MDKKVESLRKYALEMEDYASVLSTHLYRYQLASALVNDQYDELIELLLERSGAIGEELQKWKSAIKSLHKQRSKTTFEYGRRPIATTTLRIRNLFSVVVTAFLVSIAALAATYTAGYLRGKNAAMEKVVAR